MSAKMFVVGNITKELELKEVVGSDGTKKNVSNFTVACRDGKGSVYVQLTAWGSAAEVIKENTTKGSKIEIYGRYKVSSYKTKDKESEQRHYVEVESFEFLDPKPDKQIGLDV